MAWDRSLPNSTDCFRRSWPHALLDLALLDRLTRLRPNRSSQGSPLNLRVSGTRRVPLAGRCSYGLASSCSGFLAGVARLSVL
jgi:hypothetical protein